MRLLASDYDGTFKSDIKNLNLNIKSINDFREKGNKFAIVTGRSFNSIKKEIEKYNIKYDYLVCNNGLIIFNQDNKIIYNSVLNQEDVIYICNEILYSETVKSNLLYNFYSSTNKIENILEIYAEFVNERFAKLFQKYIKNIKPELLCYRDRNNLYISNNMNKASAVTIIQNIENIQKEDVYSVGDYINDINMLEAFNGYKMLHCHPKMLLKKFPITREVHTLINKINK